MDLSIIIVNWRSADYLKICLESLYKTVNGINFEFEVLVIDNASYDGSADIVTQKYKSARFIQSKENLGFSRANNRAFRESNGKLVLFLNPDTEIIGNSLVIMAQALKTLPRAGAVGATLLNSDLSLQTSCIQPFPTVLNQVLDVEFLRKRFPMFRLWGMRELFTCNGEPSIVDVVSGACIMVKRDVFAAVGMFSNDYFMYTEDVDLCYKIKKAGYYVYFVPKARVIHHGGKSSGRNEISHFHEVLMRESMARFIRKRRGHAAEKRYRIALSVSALARLALLYTISCFKWQCDKQAVFYMAAKRKWRKILYWAVGHAPEIKALGQTQTKGRNAPKSLGC